MTIFYEVHDGLYVNLTNKCPCACTFCIRKDYDSVGSADSLWLEHEPSFEEVVDALSKIDLSQYREVVFCGFGEPTEAFDLLLETASYIKNLTPDMIIRINTNGLGNLVNGYDITPKLKGLIDVVSISLNTCDPIKYNELVRPKFGDVSFSSLLEFAKRAKEFVPSIILTTVDTTISKEEESQCRNICDELGVTYRIRMKE